MPPNRLGTNATSSANMWGATGVIGNVKTDVSWDRRRDTLDSLGLGMPGA